MSKGNILLLGIGGVVIVVLAAILILVPAPAEPKPDDGEVAEMPTVPEDIQAHIDEMSDRIKVEQPMAMGVISSPLLITGIARGPWYFEASFPVILTDWDGRIIAQSPAQAKGEWMTESFVPFEVTLEFEAPEDMGEFSRRGTLIFQKDNPSGLPEHDAALEIPVLFDRT